MQVNPGDLGCSVFDSVLKRTQETELQFPRAIDDFHCASEVRHVDRRRSSRVDSDPGKQGI
jgi:hypothetical protein